jgi:hypothetical protein
MSDGELTTGSSNSSPDGSTSNLDSNGTDSSTEEEGSNLPKKHQANGATKPVEQKITEFFLS